MNKELFVFINIIDSLEKNRDNYLKELQHLITENVKNKFDKLIKEAKEKKEEIVKKNIHLLNLKEKAKIFFDSLDRNKYNDLLNINEIKNKLNINTNDINNTKNTIEEIKKNINDVKNVNNNSNRNLEYLLKNKHLFDPLIFLDESGRRYEGERKNDLKEGKGILYFPNGDRYEGEFKNDKMDGKGIYYYENGEKFEGIFKEDKKNGKGKHFLNDGTTIEEIYDNGILIEKNRNLFFNFFNEDSDETIKSI